MNHEELGNDKQARIILQQLLSRHFFGVELEWQWKEGRTLKELDKDLWIQILQTIPEMLECK